MAIHFSKQRMETVLQNHELWWEGKLDRPLVKVTIRDAYPTAETEEKPILSQKNCADYSVSPEEIIDALDQHLSTEEYLGDSFPYVNFDAFGPGVLAAFCGARLDNSSGRVWFFPDSIKEIHDIHVKYNPENQWVKRIKDIYRAGVDFWQGKVIMSMPDLGGVLDVMATFRGSENLLMDLYDEPEEVQRLSREIRDAWYEAYNDLASVLAPQHAYTDWSGLLSKKPSYILQCDFCFLIGNPMFKEFVLEGLKEDTTRLDRTIYHLDGIGELNHLDDLLKMPELNAVQWIPGSNLDSTQWIDLYKRIADAGKQIMIVDKAEGFLKTLGMIHGTPYGSFMLDSQRQTLAEELLRAR